MIRIYAARASSRAVATAPSAPSPSSSSSRALLLHTSAVLNVESARKRQARLTRQKNLAKRAELQKKAAAVRPHVILGTVVGDDAKWAACDLARILVRPEELAPDAAPQRVPLPTASASASSEAEAGAGADETTAPASAEVRVPGALAFGLRAREQRMLFQHLPLLAADMHARREMGAQPRGRARRGDGWEGHADVTDMAAQHGAELARGAAQADALGRVVDLRNANAAGIAFEDRRRIIAAFSGAGRVNDTGRTEVQAALLTLQVRNVWKHLSEFKRDVASRRSLRRLVHQRAKLLKYLKRTDRDRYDIALERLGLEPGAVEGELVV